MDLISRLRRRTGVTMSSRCSSGPLSTTSNLEPVTLLRNSLKKIGMRLLRESQAGMVHSASGSLRTDLTLVNQDTGEQHSGAVKRMTYSSNLSISREPKDGRRYPVKSIVSTGDTTREQVNSAERDGSITLTLLLKNRSGQMRRISECLSNRKSWEIDGHLLLRQWMGELRITSKIGSTDSSAG